MADREHLYRDEVSAALERASRLADENAELKQELARYRRGRDVPTLRTRQRRVPPYAVVALCCAVTLLLAGIGSTIVFAAGHAATVQAPASLARARAAVTPDEHPVVCRQLKDEEKRADEPREE